MMNASIDLGLIYQDPDPQFLIDGGVPKGAALHIIHNIEEFVRGSKRVRRAETEKLLD